MFWGRMFLNLLQNMGINKITTINKGKGQHGFKKNYLRTKRINTWGMSSASVAKICYTPGLIKCYPKFYLNQEKAIP